MEPTPQTPKPYTQEPRQFTPSTNNIAPDNGWERWGNFGQLVAIFVVATLFEQEDSYPSKQGLFCLLNLGNFRGSILTRAQATGRLPVLGLIRV